MKANGKPAKVAVTILSWNGRQHLATCLEALAGQRNPGVPWEIWVLDNGSTDGTVAWLESHHPAVRVVASPKNLGFCAGNNRLVEALDADAVALLNNDTRPAPGWLAALVEAYAASPEDVAAVSGLIVDWEGERLDFGGGAMTFDGHAFQLDFRRPLGVAKIPAPGDELPFACGGNLLVRRRSFLAAGSFDESYFAYLEDVDLGWRLWAGGERVVFAPEAAVHHRSSATSDLLGNFNRGFLFERNAYLTVYKNYDEELWPRLMPAVLLTLISRTQAMLERNNPGGESFRLDPYAGHIANTGGVSPAPRSALVREGLTGDRLLAELREKWRRFGPREFLRRGLVAAVHRLLGAPAEEAPAPRLTDPRSVAQLRAISYLLSHLDEAATSRQRSQLRRRRRDGEIFERFPLYLVPTYPGDYELFNSEAFGQWLPADLPVVRSSLAEIMELG